MNQNSAAPPAIISQGPLFSNIDASLLSTVKKQQDQISSCICEIQRNTQENEQVVEQICTRAQELKTEAEGKIAAADKLIKLWKLETENKRISTLEDLNELDSERRRLDQKVLDKQRAHTHQKPSGGDVVLRLLLAIMVCFVLVVVIFWISTVGGPNESKDLGIKNKAIWLYTVLGGALAVISLAILFAEPVSKKAKKAPLRERLRAWLKNDKRMQRLCKWIWGTISSGWSRENMSQILGIAGITLSLLGVFLNFPDAFSWVPEWKASVKAWSESPAR